MRLQARGWAAAAAFSVVSVGTLVTATAPRGCYHDSGPTGSNQPGRQMHHEVCEKSGECASLTREVCADSCRKAGYSLYGVEAGHQCYCDNVLAHPNDTAPASDCTVPCTGNGGGSTCYPSAGRCSASRSAPETCGGSYRLWVDSVSSVTPSPPHAPCPTSTIQPADPRNIFQGTLVYESGYLDQPYCQINPVTGTWVCTTTAGPVHEGGNSEHMIAQSSDTAGAQWSAPTYIEPPEVAADRDNAYGNLAVTKTGRFYAIYNMNLDNITKLPSGEPCGRTDELGHFVMRYSDDNGKTWSDDRYEVPYRETPLDTSNTFQGKVKMMWNVDQIKEAPNGWIISGFTKIGGYVQNAPQELWFLASDNLLTETNASKIRWTLLPEGDHGILPPGVTEGPPADPKGDILEEAHIVPLAMGGYYVVGRTTQGFLAATHTNATIEEGLPVSSFAPTGYAAYWSAAAASKGILAPLPTATPVRSVGSPGYGVKNPRGPITPKRMANGQYLILFYNNAGGSFGQRDPYWLAAGREAPGHGILWSQPEIVLYDRYSHTREAGGYPDFIQNPRDNSIHIIETQKNTTRIHQISESLLDGLFGQFTASTHTPGYALDLTPGKTASVPVGLFQPIGDWVAQGQGFTIDLVLPAGTGSISEGKPLFNTFPTSVGLAVGSNGSVVLSLTDTNGNTASQPGCPIQTDPLCSAVLRSSGQHSVAVVVDAGPMIATWVVDGLLCDGGHYHDFAAGWAWLPPLGGFNASEATVEVGQGYVYGHALSTSQVVANHRSRMA